MRKRITMSRSNSGGKIEKRIVIKTWINMSRGDLSWQRGDEEYKPAQRGVVAASCLSLFGFLCPCDGGTYINKDVTQTPCTLDYSVLPRSYHLKMTAQGWLDVLPDHTTGRCCPIYGQESLNRAISIARAKTLRNMQLISIDACQGNYGFGHGIVLWCCHGREQLELQVVNQNKVGDNYVL